MSIFEFDCGYCFDDPAVDCPFCELSGDALAVREGERE